MAVPLRPVATRSSPASNLPEALSGEFLGLAVPPFALAPAGPGARAPDTP